MTPRERAKDIASILSGSTYSSSEEARDHVVELVEWAVRRAVAVEREDCLIDVAAEARDCGCSARIAARIRERNSATKT